MLGRLVLCVVFFSVLLRHHYNYYLRKPNQQWWSHRITVFNHVCKILEPFFAFSRLCLCIHFAYESDSSINLLCMSCTFSFGSSFNCRKKNWQKCIFSDLDITTIHFRLFLSFSTMRCRLLHQTASCNNTCVLKALTKYI